MTWKEAEFNALKRVNQCLNWHDDNPSEVEGMLKRMQNCLISGEGTSESPYKADCVRVADRVLRLIGVDPRYVSRKGDGLLKVALCKNPLGADVVWIKITD